MNKNKTLKRMLPYLKKHRLAICFVIITSIFSTMFMVLAPFIIGCITTTLFTSIQEQVFYWNRILILLLILVALYVISQTFTFIQGWIMAKVSAKVVQQLRSDVNAKMHRLKLNYYDTHTHGDILSILTNDIDILNTTISQNITALITQVITAIGVLFMMLSISPLLSIIPIIMVPLSLLSAAKLMKASEHYYTKQQALLGQINGFIEEMYHGQDVIQTYNYQTRAMQTFNELNESLKTCSQQAETTAGAVSPITTLVNDFGYVLCAAIGCLFAIAKKISIGNVQAMLEYTWRFAEPFSQIASMITSFSVANAAGTRIFALLDENEELPDPSNSKTPSVANGSIVFDHVCFGYHENQLLMKDVSFEVKPGQKVAIVGPTGAGKTTLINLLMRFYEIQSGAIYVDGVKTSDMSKKELRKRFAMVLQDTWLFEGSIKDNIAYANETMPLETIMDCAKSACAHNFIKTLPNNYDMLLHKGGENISQGERQLLTIARALACNPEIMILDEATSNIDTHTEALIQKAMAKLMKGRTSFVIAHRLSTIKDADMILYMENGTIKEVGTHDELLAKQGKYAALYLSQFQ